MKIEDDFLEENIFDELQSGIMGADFSWYYNDVIDFDDDKNKYQFTHTFYSYNSPQSNYYTKLLPIINKLYLYSIVGIKANLLTKTPTIVENEFHVDSTDLSEEKLKQVTTSIFYVNTNNGYTKFEDGTKVESVANRLISFPANMKHTGTSCTDQKTRVVINFNYNK